jgi:hypothetical protein
MAGFGFSALEVYLLSMPMGAVHGIFSIGRYVVVQLFRKGGGLIIPQHIHCKPIS